jgi:hypothetical protein
MSPHHTRKNFIECIRFANEDTNALTVLGALLILTFFASRKIMGLSALSRTDSFYR